MEGGHTKQILMPVFLTVRVSFHRSAHISDTVIFKEDRFTVAHSLECFRLLWAGGEQDIWGRTWWGRAAHFMANNKDREKPKARDKVMSPRSWLHLALLVCVTS